MKKRIIIANVVLLVCMVALTYKLKQDWEQWDKQHNLQTLMREVKTVPPDVAVPEVQLPRSGVAGSEVTYISQNNLFHKDRNMLLPQDTMEAAKPQLTNPPVIMGMMTIEGVPYVQVRPEKGAADEGSTRLGEGDRWEGDWIVEQIQNDRIVLLAQDTREEVLWHDPTKKRSRRPPAQTAKMSAPGGDQVLTIGGSATKAGPAARTAAAAPPPPAVKPPSSSTAKALSARDRSGEGGSARDRLGSRSSSLFQSRRGSNTSSQSSRGTSTLGQPSGTTQRTSPTQRTNPFRSNQRTN